VTGACDTPVIPAESFPIGRSRRVENTLSPLKPSTDGLPCQIEHRQKSTPCIRPERNLLPDLRHNKNGCVLDRTQNRSGPLSSFFLSGGLVIGDGNKINDHFERTNRTPS